MGDIGARRVIGVRVTGPCDAYTGLEIMKSLEMITLGAITWALYPELGALAPELDLQFHLEVCSKVVGAEDIGSTPFLFLSG